ncbi:MAG TPA: hypothetical protein VGN91_13895 [Bosea sp. (in: a-proteobacteria)]|nr:hypothetical protein [Bosea sp. (in: a-proteobacteria)]
MTELAILTPTATEIRPTLMRWSEYRRSRQWLPATPGQPGANWIEYPTITGDSLHGKLVFVPPGHACPLTVAQGDVVLLGVEGELDLQLGDTPQCMKPLDLVVIPPGVAFSFINAGTSGALFFATFGGLDPWPFGSSAKPVNAGASAEYLAWGDYRRDFHWTLPWAERWGFQRGSGPYFAPETLRGHTVRQPIAQRTPWHYAARDLLFMPLSGEVEFSAAGRVWPLEPYDLLLIPAMTPYSYANHGLVESVFLSVGGKLTPGRKGRYFAEDPGWPVRRDAKVMDTEVDPYGDARTV